MSEPGAARRVAECTKGEQRQGGMNERVGENTRKERRIESRNMKEGEMREEGAGGS